MSGFEGDPRYKPLTAWQYFWLEVLFAVPVVGFIFLIVFSFSTGNYNRRSFARSKFCVVAIWLIIIIILMATGLSGVLLDSISQMK